MNREWSERFKIKDSLKWSFRRNLTTFHVFALYNQSRLAFIHHHRNSKIRKFTNSIYPTTCANRRRKWRAWIRDSPGTEFFRLISAWFSFFSIFCYDCELTCVFMIDFLLNCLLLWMLDESLLMNSLWLMLGFVKSFFCFHWWVTECKICWIFCYVENEWKMDQEICCMWKTEL